MAWIESHTSLWRHPKTMRFAKLLGVTVPQAIGHLHLLWWWALEYATDGDLSQFDTTEVATAMLWDGDEDVIMQALRQARFVDETGVIHDWEDYAGRLIEKRRTDAERLRQWRSARKQETQTQPAPLPERNADETRTYEVPYRTVPTVPDQPNRTVPEERAAAADAPPPEEATISVSEDAAPVVAVKSTRTKKTTGVGPIIDAFRDLELPAPVLIGAEPKAVMALLGFFPPGDIAECWRDFAQGHFGDNWDRDHLSFRYLANDNRMQKWQAWRDAGRPVREPHATSRRSTFPDARAYPSVANGYDLSAYDGIGHGPSTNGIGGRGALAAVAGAATDVRDRARSG